jgi:deoxycytidylate deaminase
VKGGAIISIGFNKRNTNAFVEHYINLACMAEGTVKDFCGSTHAEMDAVLQCRSKTDLRGAKIYVARVRKAKDMGTLAMAKPCRICQMVLNAYGIKRAIYSIDDLNFGVLKITEEGEG